MESEIKIRVVPADDRVEALWLLFAWEPEVQRRERLAICVAAGKADPAAFQFLLEAIAGETRVGCVWGHVVTGRIANVWPAHCVPEVVPTIADQLQVALDRNLSAAQVVCGQALLPPHAEHLAAMLLRNGYQTAARLLFLASERNQFPTELPTSQLEFEMYHESENERLKKLIDESYVGSLDAPLMNGIRSTEDVISGYKRTGNFSAERWFFVRHQDRDVGCLLLTEHGQGGHWELVYMGLTPAARGRGWGDAITRFAQWRAHAANCALLLLGVDADNQPAIATYARCGFHELDRRLALIKKLTTT